MFELNENLLFSVHGGGDSGGGMAGLVNGVLATLEEFLTLSPAEMFAHLLPGIAAMENIHPLFVHFPIALLSVFFLLDCVGSLAKKNEWRQVADWFLYLGTLFAGLTVAAGLMAAASVMHGDDVHDIMETHEHFGLSILSLAVLLSVWRFFARQTLQGALNGVYLSAGALLCLLLVLGADLGGLMVYKYGVAVEAARVAIIDGWDSQALDRDHHHNHTHAH